MGEDRSFDQQGKPSEKPNDGFTKRTKRIHPRNVRRSNYNALPERTVSSSVSAKTDVSLAKTANHDWSGSVLGLVSAVSTEQPNEPYRQEHVMTSVSSLFDYLIESIYRYVELRSMRPTPLFAIDDLRLALRYILAARIGQVANYRLPERPAEVRYPSVLGPLLAAIGRYVHPTAAYELVPALDPNDSTFEGLVTPKKNERTGVIEFSIEKPAVVDQIMSYLLNLGMDINIGLPVDILVDTDELYRLDQTVQGQLTGSGDFSPSPGVILSRALLELATLNEIYGHHRVVYAHVAALRSAVDKLARDSFTMEVGLNGR